MQEWRNTGVIPYIQIKEKIIYRQSDIDRLLENNLLLSDKTHNSI